ncbi:MAG: U32 family peptidase C-terminal domain-containing protein [Micavibrio aeruginosavorus]|uniref:U32 family peptidase C-terminal domain-containing protein n=1 Tax=Micavibrio aeruginosavorus TaxID=349221 RepID=A0A7T5UG10_9BACT|nr:MAG: U32 family peptidase C-terminal domain-containing protein [Micavibrio aeruginosavorus]
MNNNNSSSPRRRSELLMPAGSLEKLKIAILYGADAVYMGTPDMSLRTKSSFTLEDVVEGVQFAHAHGKRVYLTLNLFTHNKDILKLPEYVETVRKVKPDGLIIADPGVFQFVREHAPDLEIHISTQANICSWLSVNFWKQAGASLCVLGREVTYAELKEIREKCPDIKLEAFVHGAMCMTYSGRCLLSNFMSERGANQGNCANSCRWKYKLHVRMKDGTVKDLEITEENQNMFEFFLEEGYRPGQYMQLEEDERGAYILNSRDLCLMPKLDDYLSIGIDSLKVEGRNKSAYYVAVVARAYRMAIDSYYKAPEKWDPKPYMDELETVPNRGYTLAFHEGRLTDLSHGYENTESLSTYEYGGIVAEVRDDAFIVKVKNRIEAGDVLEFLPPSAEETVLLRLYAFENAESGEITESVNAAPETMIRIPFTLFDHENIGDLKRNFPPMSIIRKEKLLSQEQRQRIKIDKTVQNLELGQGRESALEDNRKKLQEIAASNCECKSFKSPRFGIEGCCGKGCNGCLVFWHAPEYAKAREILKKKKQGEMLSKDMVEILEDAKRA